MKLKIPFKALLVLIMLPMFALASGGEGKYTKKKTINKEFNVNDNATLKINSNYGNLDVVTWKENTIAFEITITTSGNDEENVQEKLNGITVEFDTSPSLVSARTKFNNSKSNSWWNWNKKNKVSINVHYLVKIPITNNVDLNNDYGSINLDKLKGNAKISCDYGKVTAKELLGDENSFNFDYSQNCYFEYIKNGKINADYSGFTISKTNTISINADYSNSKIEFAENVDYNCDYGSLKIDKVNTLNGNGDYLTLVIGDLYQNLYLKADYGVVKIAQINENTKNVSIGGDYVGIKLGYAPNYNFNFDINLDYASLNSSDLEFLSKNIESTSKHYTGYHGKPSSGNLIKINSDYGNVSLNKN
ncbi:hypothetical protein [Seonamhaeicola sp. ML3]|uniref:hypothetical protein n=1 Tax=Seonamhaeicola sp. ML3 TaxID=2937786 RepID=UPI0020100B40|nr:hypothetical protein [Seonamhaeicola sp. ML3]